MGYTRVKQLSSGHNSVDYHEKCPRGKGVPRGSNLPYISARRARREGSELKREHTGGTRAALATLAALAARAARRARRANDCEGGRHPG